MLAKSKHLQRLQLIVDLPTSESDFCEKLEVHSLFGALKCPPLNDTLARVVAKKVFEDFLALNPETELEELTIVFRRVMIYDRGETSILSSSVKVSKGKGKDEPFWVRFEIGPW
jgi:hypothetical protein